MEEKDRRQLIGKFNANSAVGTGGVAIGVTGVTRGSV